MYTQESYLFLPIELPATCDKGKLQSLLCGSSPLSIMNESKQQVNKAGAYGNGEAKRNLAGFLREHRSSWSITGFFCGASQSEKGDKNGYK